MNRFPKNAVVLLLAMAILGLSGVVLGAPAATSVVGSFSAPAPFYSVWKIKKWSGNVSVKFLKTGSRSYIRLSSNDSSWSFIRSVKVNLKKTSILSWDWKVDELPKGGDGRVKATDDEAAQLYVIFPAKKIFGLWGGFSYRILGYTWETTLKNGTTYTSPRNANTRIFVLRGSGDGTGRWYKETRDVAADFHKTFGGKAPNPIAVSIQIDSNDTRSKAESAFSSLVFKTK